MTKPWSDMKPREQDAALHQVAFGKHVEYGPIPCPDKRPGCMVAHLSYTSEGVRVPSYTTSLDAMRLVEDELAQQGLQREYLHRLAGMQQGSIACDVDCLDYESTPPLALWSFVCATPAQRAEAAYAVLREHHATHA